MTMMKKRYIFLFWIACFFLSIKICPKGIDNTISLLLQNNFFIPKESSICTFIDTMDDTGSGEGWLYGEDDKYYYGMRLSVDKHLYETETKPAPTYFILKKGQESENFHKHDYKTWDKKEGVKLLSKKLRSDSYRGYCK
jgi:hypothetical protein